MSKTFKDLTQEQVDRHNAGLAKLGIDPDKISPYHQTSDHPGGMIVGPEHNYTKKIEVNSIEELNTLVGYPCEYFHSGKTDDSDLDYPAPFAKTHLAVEGASAHEIKEQLTTDEHEQVKQAMVHFLQGDSAKVDSYKDIINAVHFENPVTLTVASAQDILITAQNPLIFHATDGQPITANYGTITVENGGYIQSNVPLNLTCQVFTNNNNSGS